MRSEAPAKLNPAPAKGQATALFVGAFAVLMLVLYFAPVRMDEVWCFAFSNRVLEGWLPYRDFNVVIPPLFLWMGAPFAKSLMVYRIFGALIAAGLVLAGWRICRLRGWTNLNSWLFVAGMLVMVDWYPDANYNLTMVLFLLLAYGSGIELLTRDMSRSAWMLGAFLMLACLTKQNVPALALLAVLGFLAFKTVRREIPGGTLARTLGGAAIPAATVMIYFLATGTGSAFLDYAVFGLGDFAGNLVIHPEAAPFMTSAAGFLALLIVGAVRNSKTRSAALLGLCIGVPACMILYPIADGYHGLVLVLLLGGMVPGILGGDKPFGKIPATLVVILVLVLGGSRCGMAISQTTGDTVRMTLPPYQGIVFPGSLAEDVTTVAAYIRDQESAGLDVAVVSAVAYLYILPARDYNNYLDLVARGNMGGLELSDLVRAASRKDVLLLRNTPHWQDYPGLQEALQSKGIMIGKVSDFWIIKTSGVEGE